MYNSRGRYAKYGNYPLTVSVPENYSGNAFDVSEGAGVGIDVDTGIDAADEIDADAVLAISDDGDKRVNENAGTSEKGEISDDAKESSSKKESAECSANASERRKGLFPGLNFNFNFNPARLFGGGIGTEELLIIGLILLFAQSEGNEDMILLLILLFFIG